MHTKKASFRSTKTVTWTKIPRQCGACTPGTPCRTKPTNAVRAGAWPTGADLSTIQTLAERHSTIHCPDAPRKSASIRPRSTFQIFLGVCRCEGDFATEIG